MGLFNSNEHRQAVVSKWNTLGNVALEAIEAIPFIGKGTGASKPVTAIDNVTIIEEFDINDELYLIWHIPTNTDRTVPVQFHLGWYLNASEVSTTVSWDLDLLPMDQDNGTLITDTATNIQIVDYLQSSIAYKGNDALITFDLSTVPSGVDHIHFRVTRVASSSDSTAKPRLEHVHVQYTRAWV